MTQKTETKIPKVFSCLLEEEQKNLWVAHCLDFDLATSGKTEDEAWKRLLKVVKMHVEHCFTHRPDGLELKADKRLWDIFETVKQGRKDPIRTEKIPLTLIPQPQDQLDFFWIEGVDAANPNSVQTVH